MARQADYLASLLHSQSEEDAAQPGNRRAPTTLLNRETALARVSSGEVRQVTQLALDPSRVRVWAGNARIQSGLTEENCRDLIDSIIAEGGQRVPVIVRRVDPANGFDYEVIAGTRRHFAISWLRANSYPDMQLIAQVQNIDDEAAFRLADIENRARKDISDMERARNYAAALVSHYGGHQTRMAERLRVSKGWLSKMLKVAGLPDDVTAAFGSLADIQLKPAYNLALALDDQKRRHAIIQAATELASEQARRRVAGELPLEPGVVFRELMAARSSTARPETSLVFTSALGRPMLAVHGSNRQGITVKVLAGSGATHDEIVAGFSALLDQLKEQGRGPLR